MLETAQDLSGQNCFKIKIVTLTEQSFKKVTVLAILLLRTGHGPPRLRHVLSGLCFSRGAFGKAKRHILNPLLERRAALNVGQSTVGTKAHGLLPAIHTGLQPLYLPESNYFSNNFLKRLGREAYRSQTSVSHEEGFTWELYKHTQEQPPH